MAERTRAILLLEAKIEDEKNARQRTEREKDCYVGWCRILLKESERLENEFKKYIEKCILQEQALQEEIVGSMIKKRRSTRKIPEEK